VRWPAQAVFGLLALVGVAAPAASDDLVAELLHYIGLPESSRSALLERCEVLHTGLRAQETLAEEVAAAGAMVLVTGVDARAVLDAFLDAETFRQVHGARRVEAPSAIAEGSPSLLSVARQPLRSLNLSSVERAEIEAAGDGMARSRALGRLLDQRAEAYRSRGLDGLAPYVRPGGGEILPAVEVAAAVNSLSLLADDFPGFIESLGRGSPSDIADRRILRVSVPFESSEVIALSSESRRVYADRAVGADIHFFATSGYNAMVTLLAVAPVDDGWLAFAINHTFTDAVLGMGTSLKRKVARRRVGETLGRHLQAVRSNLGGGGCRGVGSRPAGTS